MDYQVTRTIDELGRIIIPQDLRQELEWGTGDKIKLTNTNGKLILELVTPE